MQRFSILNRGSKRRWLTSGEQRAGAVRLDAGRSAWAFGGVEAGRSRMCRDSRHPCKVNEYAQWTRTEAPDEISRQGCLGGRYRFRASRNRALGPLARNRSPRLLTRQFDGLRRSGRRKTMTVPPAQRKSHRPARLRSVHGLDAWWLASAGVEAQRVVSVGRTIVPSCRAWRSRGAEQRDPRST